MLIYKITNTVNGKIYIGQTINTLNRRWSAHKLTANDLTNTTHLYSAMRKYGIENFTIEPLAYCDTLHDLNFLEEAFIKKFDTVNNGYNILHGGNNRKHSEESISKMKGKHLGIKPTLGMKMSEETKDKLRKAKLGKVMDNTVKHKISKSMSGKVPWNKGLKKETDDRVKNTYNKIRSLV